METPIIKAKKGLSPIWILPLVALILGGYLLYKDFQESGVMITVRLNDANGLTPGKTKVYFKGLPIGTLKEFTVTHDLQCVDAHLELLKKARGKITSSAKFWIVKPEVSMNRITGLDTLVKGSYFEVLPGNANDEEQNFFTALTETPPVSSQLAGLKLTLTTTQPAVLSSGSPILYKKIEIGEVVSQHLEKDGSVQVEIFIYQKYQDHVKTTSLFYVSGGINLEASLTKVSIKVDPLKSILQGGITMETPEDAKAIADSGMKFHLYEDYEQIQHIDDIEIQLDFSIDHPLNIGAAIRYQGLKVGIISALTLNDNLKIVHAKAYVGKQIAPFLRKGAYIWIVKPSLGLANTAHLDTFITGSYLNILPGPGTGDLTKTFVVHDEKPANMLVSNGLNLVLETDRLGSLGYDKPVYYRQVQVGHTTGYDLSPTGQNVFIYINIHEPYVDLIRENTKFWNSSGVRIKGGLMTSMKISTESLASLLDGGITFSTPERKDMGNRISNGFHFTLHSDPDDQWLNWSPALQLGKPLETKKETTQEKHSLKKSTDRKVENKKSTAFSKEDMFFDYL